MTTTTSRKRIRALRREARTMKPPCDGCERCPACRAACQALEDYLTATLPGGESIVTETLYSWSSAARDMQGEDAQLEHVDSSRRPPVNADDVLPAETAMNSAFEQAIVDDLLMGKLTLQAIADEHSCDVAEVQAIADAMLGATGDKILRAIITKRLTGCEAALEFGISEPNVSRRKRRFRERWKPGC